MGDEVLGLLCSFEKGTCNLMCPEKERKLREQERLLHVLEMKPGTKKSKLPAADISRTVKCFARSAAGQERRVASDLRPPHVLLETLHYLLGIVVIDSRYDWSVVYEFVFDRLRAIRQDMIIQGLCPRVSIMLLQPMIRFHAYAAYRLCEEPVSKFDPQINHTHLLECLKTLLSLYDEEDSCQMCKCSVCARLEQTDCKECVKPDSRSDYEKEDPSTRERAVSDASRSEDDPSEARVEMEALYLTVNLGSAPVVGRALELGLHKRDPALVVALKVSLSHWLGHYVPVVRNLTGLSPLVMCAAVLHLPAIRRHALHVMSVAFSSRNLSYPLHKLANLLLYSSDRDAANDCRRYNLTMKDGSVFFDKKLFDTSASTSPLQREPFVEKKLRECDLPSLLLGT